MTLFALALCYLMVGILLASLRLVRQGSYTIDELFATLVLYAIVWPVFVPLVFWGRK
jgi:hypothetical protein